MNLAPQDQALLDAALNDLVRAANTARQAYDLPACRAALLKARHLCIRAYQAANDGEEGARRAEQLKLENA